MRAATSLRSRPARVTCFHCVSWRSAAAAKLPGRCSSPAAPAHCYCLSSPCLRCAAHLLTLALRSRDAGRTRPGRGHSEPSAHAQVRGRLVTRWRTAACPHAAALLLVISACPHARGRARSGDRSLLANRTLRCHSRRPPASFVLGRCCECALYPVGSCSEKGQQKHVPE